MQELEKDAKMCKYRVWSRTWKMEFSTAPLFLCFVDAMVLPISTTINRHFLYLIIHAQIGCRPMRVVITRPVPLNDEQTMYIYINRIIFFLNWRLACIPCLLQRYTLSLRIKSWYGEFTKYSDPVNSHLHRLGTIFTKPKTSSIFQTDAIMLTNYTMAVR